MNNALLMDMTASTPLKTIAIDGRPYLERYYAGPSFNGGMDPAHDIAMRQNRPIWQARNPSGKVRFRRYSPFALAGSNGP